MHIYIYIYSSICVICGLYGRQLTSGATDQHRKLSLLGFRFLVDLFDFFDCCEFVFFIFLRAKSHEDAFASGFPHTNCPLAMAICINVAITNHLETTGAADKQKY